ncbi:pheromone processing endoprotease [Mortierella sp. AD094]|nr:pheromone processing endoprotease [Mortierella sp. AD094]
MGDLLGLRFESRVGMLPDYFLYSSPKAVVAMNSTPSAIDGSTVGAGSKKRNKQNYHSKRSFLVNDSPPLEERSEVPEEEGVEELVSIQPEEADTIVERFYQLKERYTRNQSRGSKQKRHDEQAELVRAMGDIHKQELRQRIKKRAPLPDAHPDPFADPDPRPLVQNGSSGQAEVEVEEEELAEEEAAVQGEEEENEDMEPEEQISEQDEVEDAEIEEEESQDKGEEYQPAGEDQPEDDMADLLGFEDPGFRYQWHLHNTKEGHDINVTGVWEQGINGTGVNVAIIDDGLDMDSEDLAPNFFKEGSWDFNDHTALPKPRLVDDQHGIRCAGEIASAKNDLCGVGVAYGAKVAGLRILSGQITDVDEAAALNYRFQDNHIYSCSWGPPDDGRSMDAPKGVVVVAMINGIKNGRSGLGSIYVFATGNGGNQDDDCNFDGYTNSLYTVSIGAIDRAQRHPYYSEACSAQLAVTYSNGGGSAIYTCDVGERRCFGQHGGTSAAAPIAAGMIALVLSVRPDLTWRDVQYLLMTTAVPVSLDDPDWKETASGRLFNHRFGYGSLDAYKLVEAARTFKSLRPQTSLHPPVIHVGKTIPQGGKGVLSTFRVTKEDLEARGVQLGVLEHITVTVNIEHERRGDVEVILMSPNKVESRLGAKRRFDTATTGFVDWTFMTVKHWEENPIGPLNESPTKEQEQEQVLNETTNDLDELETSTDSKVTVNIDSSVTKESGDEGEKGDQEAPEDKAKETKDDKGDVIKEDIAQNQATDEEAEWVVETESEEELASIVNHTLYVFCGVLGIAGLIIGFIAKRKTNGQSRGSYVGIRGSSLDMNVRDFENDDDDIDLPPHGHGSDSNASINNDEGEEDYDRSASEPSPSNHNSGISEMSSVPHSHQEQPPRSGRARGDEHDGSTRFEVGSDTDEEDFFVTSSPIKPKSVGGSGRATWLAQATSSPATLKVEEP